MDLVTHTQRQHSNYGVVTIERIYREYSSVEVSETETQGRVPSEAILIDFKDDDGQVHTETAVDFADRLD
ncbi:hypothetical protein JCM18237_16950 [Halorubrum luteum]